MTGTGLCAAEGPDEQYVRKILRAREKCTACASGARAETEEADASILRIWASGEATRFWLSVTGKMFFIAAEDGTGDARECTPCLHTMAPTAIAVPLRGAPDRVFHRKYAYAIADLWVPYDVAKLACPREHACVRFIDGDRLRMRAENLAWVRRFHPTAGTDVS